MGMAKRHRWEPADEATQKRISPWGRGEVHRCKDCGCIRHAKAFRSAYFVGDTCEWSAPPCAAPAPAQAGK